jgi:excisionase family DNA binding protein
MLFKQCQENDEADVTYLNVKDAAKLLGVQPSLIYAKCNNGNLPHVRVGKYYKFRKDELLQWVNEPKPVDVNIDDYVNRYLQKNVLKG